RCVQLVAQLLERRRRRLDLRVVRLHVVPVLLEALRHVAAHAAETDHAELHRYTSSRRMRATRRPRSCNDAKSPAACARISLPKPNGWFGIGSSAPVSSTTCRKSPVGGPPLCNCPVEWRYRGPKPCVTTQPVASRARAASSSTFRSLSAVGSTKAWMHT